MITNQEIKEPDFDRHDEWKKPNLEKKINDAEVSKNPENKNEKFTNERIGNYTHAAADGLDDRTKKIDAISSQIRDLKARAGGGKSPNNGIGDIVGELGKDVALPAGLGLLMPSADAKPAEATANQMIRSEQITQSTEKQATQATGITETQRNV